MKTSKQFRKKLLASLIATSVVAIAAAPAISWAQSADANLRGHATAGATVTAKNVATGSVRVTKADKDGSYALVGLQPGTYTVDAGPGTAKTVTLSVASTAQLDLSGAAPTAAKATTLNAVTVTGIDTTLQDVKTSEVGTTVSLQQIANLPQITRNFLEFADIVPGMMFTTENGKTSLGAGAQPDGNMNVYIDGVGQKNYVHGGAISGQAGPSHNGDEGNPFPQLAIGEYKVITSNYKAEYDQISSAAITAETKSGTNEFHGEVFETFNSSNWRAETPAEEYAGKKTNGVQREYGGAFGGPIIKDKLHFFVSYEGKSFDTPTTTTGLTDTYNGVPYVDYLPASAKAQLGPSAMPFKENLYFGKLDWEPTTSDRFELSTKIRKENQIYGAGATYAASALYNYKDQDKRVDARWQHSSDAWFNEFMWNYENTLDSPSAITDQPATTYFWNSPVPHGQVLMINSQDPRQFFDARQIGNTLQDNLTFNDINWHGDHVIKMGVKYTEVTLSNRDSSTAANYFYNVGPDGTETTPYEVVFGKLNNGLPLTAVSKNTQFGTYIQDDWDVNDKLQLNLGVRWDYERTPEWLDYRTPQSVLDAIYAPTYQYNGQTINNSYAQTLAQGGINVGNYISTGSNRKAQKNEIQPRLGFSYDINGDQEHVIFGGIGRAYDRNLFGLLSLENTKNALSEPSIYFESPSGGYNGSSSTGTGCVPGAANGTNCFVWDPKYLNAANLQGLGSGVGEVDMVNNHIRDPYSDQLSLGMRNQLGDWNISTTLARILQYDTVVGWYGNRYPGGAFYQNGTQWGSPGVPGIGGLILWDNAGTTYNTQFLLSAEKPFTQESGWGMTIAYTWTHATENHPYQDPGSYAFDLPKPSYYPFESSSVAPKHRLVMTGTYAAPWGIMLGAKLTLSTPIPSNTICSVSTYGADACGAQIVAGQLANAWPVTAVPSGGGRFLVGGPIFGYRELDLQATKNVDLGHGFTLQVRADVLNVLNFHNYADVVDAYSSSGQYQPYYNPIGNIYGVPRTFKLTADVKF